ncbi:kinase-like protein [Tuber magnatum]|uniref:Kinase-like protein n=1 Tax=Tuber magnatum TaxID=42249 RepID=A0A317SIG7_9PEZI|nr:kinase-like protein [Tuber magnatum]
MPAPATVKAPPDVHPLERYPRARLIYKREDNSCQVWDLGNGKLYKFRPHRRGLYESDIHALIQRSTSIPIPTIYREWVSAGRGGSVHHMIMQKIEGEPLYKAYTHLSKSEKGRLAVQLGDYLNQLHGIRSSSIRSVGGGPLHDEHGFLFYQRNAAHGPFSDDQSFWLALTSHLRRSKSRTMQKALAQLRHLMPHTLPAVLTHTDLHQGNILVRNGNIAAIIDWEGAGFFPRWMEYVRYHPLDDSRLFEFENAVVRRMRPYPVARRFKMILDALGSSDLRGVEWGLRELKC